MKIKTKEKILVTGGAGFIGSALVWALNNRGQENIVITDYLGTSEKWKNLVPLCYADYLEADDFLARLKHGEDAFGQFTRIFHLGACSATTEMDASYLVRNNYEYTKTLAHWAAHQNARFVYASSAATYGDGSQGMQDSVECLPSLRPLNAYGYSKQMFDLYAMRTGLIHQICGLKYFNVFGPNENHKGEMRSLVCKAYKQISETGKISLFKSHRPDFKDGEQKRDFLYVKDAVDMTIHLSETESANGLFNLGSGGARTWLDLAHALFAAMGRAPAIEFVDMPEVLRGKYQYFTQADISALRSTGYATAVTSLEESVADYVKHYLTPGKSLGEVLGH